MSKQQANEIAKRIKQTHYTREADFQADLIKWLKAKGCFVIKHQAGAGVPVGTPDLSAYKEGFYLFIEVKLRKNSKHQPGQDALIRKLDDWSYAKFIWPERFPELEEDLWNL